MMSIFESPRWDEHITLWILDQRSDKTETTSSHREGSDQPSLSTRHKPSSCEQVNRFSLLLQFFQQLFQARVVLALQTQGISDVRQRCRMVFVSMAPDSE